MKESCSIVVKYRYAKVDQPGLDDWNTITPTLKFGKPEHPDEAECPESQWETTRATIFLLVPCDKDGVINKVTARKYHEKADAKLEEHYPGAKVM